jgi:hypothetical protein
VAQGTGNFFSPTICNVEPIALTSLDDLPIALEIQLEDGPPAQLVQAIGALLDQGASPSKRQAVRGQARTAVMTFVRRQRAQGTSADRVMMLVRAAYRRARATVQDGPIDHLAAPLRALREEVVRWAMMAESRQPVPSFEPAAGSGSVSAATNRL